MTQPIGETKHGSNWNAIALDLAKDNDRLRAERAELQWLLRRVVNDVLKYERINNLAPTPGRLYCWDSIADACAALAKTANETEPT